MPDADNNFGGSLGLDFRKWWRATQELFHSKLALFILDFRGSLWQLVLSLNKQSCLQKNNNNYL